MKILIGVDFGAYTFNAAAKTVTLTGLNAVALEQVLLITNVNTNEIIYQFNKVGYGATIAANVLTLDFNTAAMSNSDSLQIFIDYESNLATSTKQDTLIAAVDTLESIFTDVIGFETIVNLTSGSTYSSGLLALSPPYSQVLTNILSDRTGTLNVYWYSDAGGTDLVRTLTVAYTAGDGFLSFGAPAFTKYVKYEFTNSAGASTTDFYYTTKFLTKPTSPQIITLKAPIAFGMVGELTRSVLVGETTAGGGAFVNVKVNPSGTLETNATLAAGTALIGKVGIDQVTTNANEVVTKTGSTTVVSNMIAAVETGLAKDGTDITTPSPAMPAGGVGIRGWLSAIWTKLNASLAVTGTFWQATQPVSGTFFQATQPVSGTVAVSTNSEIGIVTETAPATDTASSGLNGRLQRIAQRLTSLITALGSPFQAGGSIGNTTFEATQVTAANLNATVTPIAIIKGTQSATGFTVQQLNNAGRNARHFMLDVYTAAPLAEAVQSVVQWFNNASVAGTTQPEVVTAGKTLRLTNYSMSTKSLATVGSAVVRIRANTAGLGVLASPLVFSMECGSRAGATTTAMTGGMSVFNGVFPEGLEFPQGTGLAFSMAGYGPTGTLTLQGVTRFQVYGYEY